MPFDRYCSCHSPPIRLAPAITLVCSKRAMADVWGDAITSRSRRARRPRRRDDKGLEGLPFVVASHDDRFGDAHLVRDDSLRSALISTTRSRNSARSARSFRNEIGPI